MSCTSRARGSRCRRRRRWAYALFRAPGQTGFGVQTESPLTKRYITASTPRSGKSQAGRAFRAHTADTTHIYGEPLISTMSRTALIENITAMLEDADFLVSDRCAVRPKSFDVAARRDEDLVLLKILGNVDALDAETGAEMRRLGEYLQATPMVIGIRTRDEELKPGVVYFRHGVPVINPDTGYDLFVEGMPPHHLRGPRRALRQPRRRPAGRRARGARLVARPSRHRTRRLATHRLEVRRRDERLHRGGDPAGRSVQRAVLQPGRRAGRRRRGPRRRPHPSAPETDPDDEHVLHVLHERTRDSRSTRPPGRRSRPSRRTRELPARVLTGHSTFTPAAEKRARIMSSIGEVARTRSVYFTEENEDRESVDGTALVS